MKIKKAKINVLFLQNHKDDKSSKILNIFFKFFHIFLAFDLGYLKNKRSRVNCLFKLLSITQCLVISALCTYSYFISLDFETASWDCFVVVQYLTYHASYFMSQKDLTFCEYQQELLVLDQVLGVESKSYNLETKILITFLVLISLRVVVCVIYCVLYPQYCVVPHFMFLTLLIFVSLDFMIIIYLFIYYTAYCRLAKFHEHLLDSKTDVVKFQHLYKSLTDSISRAKNGFDSMYIVSLLFNIPELLIEIYTVLTYFKHIDSNATASSMITGYLSLLQTFLLMYSPALCADMLTAQAEKLKITLHDRLLTEKDPQHCSDIVRFICYIEARPLKYRVWRLIPLDCSLPALVLQLVVTYIIVIVQLTHLY